MSKVYLFSGPCGCGKTTLANAWAQYLIDNCGKHQVYVIHGDDFHKYIAETQKRLGPDCPGFLYWPDILAFIWECILATADLALRRGLDVIIDYVVEDELPSVLELVKKHDASLYYLVLTAPEDVLRQRLLKRGDVQLTERSLFLKNKLEQLPENQGHLLPCGDKTPEQLICGLNMDQYRLL
jgi:predicted kinase